MYDRENLIKKLNRVYKRGYVPSRNLSNYSGFSFEGIAVSSLYNCFAHACCGWTNDMIIASRLTCEESEYFGNFYDNFSEPPEVIEKRILKLVNDAGLEIVPCQQNALLKNNQWKVALYFKDGYGKFNNFHFLKYEPKNNLWTSKFSHYSVIETFDTLPQCYDDTYKFYNTYKITNPFAANENE